MTAVPVAVQLHLDQRKLAAQVFDHLAARGEFIDQLRKDNEEAHENFGRPGRDPISAGTALASLFMSEGWNTQLDIGALYGNWEQIVGTAIAQQTKIMRVDDGILTISASNPAWQQTIRLMEQQMLQKINEYLPSLKIHRIVVNGGLGRHPRTNGSVH